MNAMLWKNRLLFALCVVAMSAAQTKAAPKLSEIRHGKVFVRFSPDVFAELQRQPFNKRTKVADVILGTKVYGHCETQGTAKLEPNQEGKGFKLVVTGHCVTTSVGENGPATIRSTTTTDFVATSPITFDREIGFQAGQVSVNAKTRVHTDDVQATQGGLVGRIVRNVAERRVKEAKPAATEIAQDKTSKRIEAAITAQLEVQLAEVNRSLERLKKLVAVLNPQLTSEACFCASPDQMLLYFEGNEIDHTTLFRELPEFTSGSELWIHQSAVDDDLQKQLTAFTIVRDATGVVVDCAKQLLEATPVKTSTNTASALPSTTSAPAATEPLLRRHGDWFVIRIPLATAQPTTK